MFLATEGVFCCVSPFSRFDSRALSAMGRDSAPSVILHFSRYGQWFRQNHFFPVQFKSLGRTAEWVRFSAVKKK